MFGKANGVELSDVASTMLLMLYGRALESRSSDPILSDPVGERFVDQIKASLRTNRVQLQGTPDAVTGQGPAKTGPEDGERHGDELPRRTPTTSTATSSNRWI